MTEKKEVFKKKEVFGVEAQDWLLITTYYIIKETIYAAKPL